jgi:hypothetical protein
MGSSDVAFAETPGKLFSTGQRPSRTVIDVMKLDQSTPINNNVYEARR